MARRGKSQQGLTLVELIVAFTIMTLLTAMSVPLARSQVRRQKEADLRLALKEIHVAIDKYKDAADRGELGQIKSGTEGYPETLEILVEGVKGAAAGSGPGNVGTAIGAPQTGVGSGNNATTNNNSASNASGSEKKYKFLRRIPKDPFTNTTEWGKRSVQDDGKSTSWGGQNVFSVYSRTTDKAKDGTPYSEW